MPAPTRFHIPGTFCVGTQVLRRETNAVYEVMNIRVCEDGKIHSLNVSFAGSDKDISFEDFKKDFVF